MNADEHRLKMLPCDTGYQPVPSGSHGLGARVTKQIFQSAFICVHLRFHYLRRLQQMAHPRPATVGQLKQTGYRPVSVKDELRRNLIKKLKNREELFPGIVG